MLGCYDEDTMEYLYCQGVGVVKSVCLVGFPERELLATLRAEPCAGRKSRGPSSSLAAQRALRLHIGGIDPSCFGFAHPCTIAWRETLRLIAPCKDQIWTWWLADVLVKRGEITPGGVHAEAGNIELGFRIRGAMDNTTPRFVDFGFHQAFTPFRWRFHIDAVLPDTIRRASRLICRVLAT